MRRIARRSGAIAWLTLGAALVITGDLVIDVAFEEAEVQASDFAALPEAPDNAAEHILMPSQKAGSFTASCQAGGSAALHLALPAVTAPQPLVERASPTRDRPPRSSPIPLSLPLRI